MSAFLPAPSTMVVLSLSTVMRLARPRSLSVRLSSLRPRSSVIAWPPVSTAMSFSISLRRSPKPGALTAQTCSVPRSLLTTSVASASPSTSSAMMQQRRARLGHLLEHRQEVLHVGELLLVDEDERVLEHRLHALRVGHEVGRQVAAVELHALDHVQRRLHRLRFLDGDDAFLADLLHGLGQDVADDGLAVGADGADLGDLGLALGGLGLLLEVLDDLGDGRVDAALDVHRVVAGGDQLASPRCRWPAPARSRWWCRHRRCRRSWRRPPSPSARPCSRACPRARSPWRR